MKKYIVTIFLILLTTTFIGCNQKEDTTTTQNEDSTTTSSNTSISIQEFYEDIVVYESRLNEIVGSDPIEPRWAPKTSHINPTLSNDVNDWIKTITREEILASHYNTHFDMVYDSYLEQLVTTQAFVSYIKELIEDQEDIPLFEPFHPLDQEDKTFTLILSEEGYILIDALVDTMHLYLKIGLNEDLLEYSELTYYYAGNSLSPKDEIEMDFTLFKFIENKEATHIVYSSGNSSVQYTSIERDQQFTISTGDSLEGIEEAQNGYILNFYDRALNTQSYLTVVGDEIINETYDIFDEYGQVYRYEDYNNAIRLQVNFVTATGWDYVVASDASSEEIDPLTGIFLNDGTKIYDDWFNYTYTPTYGHLGLWIHLDSKEDLTNEIFSLNQYGMNLDHPKANIEFFNLVDIDSFEQIKSKFSVDNLDFFATDLHRELYLYIDQDIRNDLEGLNEEPIVATGDVASFSAALSSFANHLNTTPSLSSTSTTLIKILDNDHNVLATTSSENSLSIDLVQMYIRNYTRISGSGVFEEYSYYIDGTKGNLVEYEIDGPVVRYNILSEEASSEKFFEQFNEVFNSGDFSYVRTVTKVNDTTYELMVTSKFLGSNGVDLNTLFQQEGINGLSDQDIKITYTFSEDYSSYQISFEITGLSMDEFLVEITSTEVTTVEEVTVISPLDLGYLIFQLPQSIDNILFNTGPSSGRYVLGAGYSYMKLDLKAGNYSVTVRADYSNPSITVMDEDMNVIEFDGTFTAPNDGYYYLKIYCPFSQSADIYIDDFYLPEFYYFDLDPFDGTFEATVVLEGISGSTITVPSSNEDRVLIIHPYLVSDMSEDDMLMVDEQLEELHIYGGFNLTSMFEPEPCYLYLPKDTEIDLQLNGYFSGTFGFTYEYISVPTGAFDNTYDWVDLSTSPILWMTEESPIAHVNFTITSSGSYTLETIYSDFGYSYQNAELYDSSGSVISYDWMNSVTLAPGNYYIEFTPGYTETLLVLVIPSISKVE
ncbi:MAG: hypothetical protein AB7U79_02340 [Candidatus Izemoplasmatales bacterium]